jgi:hypothetical protein
VRAYALAEIRDDNAVDVFVRREDAFAALEDAINDEPDWARILYVAPIELDEREVSPNQGNLHDSHETGRMGTNRRNARSRRPRSHASRRNRDSMNFGSAVGSCPQFACIATGYRLVTYQKVRRRSCRAADPTSGP